VPPEGRNLRGTTVAGVVRCASSGTRSVYSRPRRASTTQVAEGGGPNADRGSDPLGRIGPAGP
jgi:hypothetical protein